MKILGLLACTSNKTSSTGTAKEVYSKSNMFKEQIHYLEENCDEVRIVSAKHGLITPLDIIQPYDFAVKELVKNLIEYEAWKIRVGKQIQQLAPNQILSLLPLLYSRCLDWVSGIEIMSPQVAGRGWVNSKVIKKEFSNDTPKEIKAIVRAQYSSLPPLQKYQANLPFAWIREIVATSKLKGVHLSLIENCLNESGYRTNTIRAQMNRTRTYQFHRVDKDSRVFNTEYAPEK